MNCVNVISIVYTKIFEGIRNRKYALKLYKLDAVAKYNLTVV